MALQMIVSKREKDNVYLGPYNCVLWMREVLLKRAVDMQMLIDMHLRLFDPENGEQLAEFWYDVENDHVRFIVGSDGKEYEADSMMVHIKLKQVAGDRWDRMEEILSAQIGIATWKLLENLTGSMCKPAITKKEQEIMNSETFVDIARIGTILIPERMKTIGLNKSVKELMLPGEIMRDMPSNMKRRLDGTGIKLVSCVIVDEEEMEELPWS